MGDLQSFSRDTTQKIKALNDKKNAYQPEVDKIFNQLQKARLDAAQIATEKHLQSIIDLDNQIQNMEDRLTTLYKASDSCKTDCDAIETEINDTEKMKFQAQKDRRNLAQQNADDVRAYDKKKAVADALEQNYQDAAQKFNQMNRDLLQLHKDYLDLYSSYGKMEGVRVAMNYTSNWDANLSTLRMNNPGFQFEKIETENAKLFASITSVNDVAGDLAVIAYEMPGIPKDRYMDLGSGFPQSISANLVLSLVGACPMLHPEYFDIQPGYGANKMAYGLTITYDFPAAMVVRATAHYNMYKMYEKIVSSGSSGGFFSSRSWTNVEEHTFFKDSFSIDWKTQDPANSVSEERRLEIEHEMRAHIIERIASLALPSAPNRDAILAAGAPPVHGAVVVSNSLMQACPGNVYCVAGSLILTSLDAIFGSSSATASYIQTQNFDATETWSQSQTILKPWVTSYVSKSN
jgi:hypothetical protein